KLNVSINGISQCGDDDSSACLKMDNGVVTEDYQPWLRCRIARWIDLAIKPSFYKLFCKLELPDKATTITIKGTK
ncbi:MAG: hypothetical protein MHPSP_003937, partial [Paramarteilia canceri]